MKTYTLRPRQREALRAAWIAMFKRGYQSVLVQAPTGFGKTILSAEFIDACFTQFAWESMFMACRREIIHQSARKLAQADLMPGIIMRGDLYTPGRKVQVASIQSYLSWVARGKIAAHRPHLLVVDECFPGDVEILTERGWCRFDALPQDVKVAQYAAGNLTWAHPTAYIRKPFAGELVRLVSDKTIDLRMTPGHEIILRSKDGRERKVAVADAKLNAYYKLPVAARAFGHERPLTPFERLMIAAQADGSMHWKDRSIAFSFSKERKIARFLQLMADGGFQYSETHDAPRNIPGRKERRRFIVRNLPPCSKRVYEFFDLASMGANLARAIIDEAVEWDGSRLNGTGLYYSSTSSECADFYQAVAVLAGYRTAKKVQIDPRKASYKPVHRLFIQPSVNSISAQSIRRESEPYTGEVYCVRVPAGNIVVRSGGYVTITGNCHSMLSKRVLEVIREHLARGGKVLGLTATPVSKRGIGLADVYQTMIHGPQVQELIDEGTLVPVNYFMGIQPDVSGLKINDGDYTEADLDKVVNQTALVGDIVEAWYKHSAGRPTIGFAASVAHSMHLAQVFRNAGLKAVHIDGTTDKKIRDHANEDLEAHRIDAIFNYGTHVEGSDIPPVSCIIDACPSASLMRVLQKGGRGLRISPETGKKDLNYHDHSGNILLRHGRLELHREWKLTNGRENIEMNERAMREQVIERVCPSCGYLFKGAVCLNCHEPWVRSPEEMEIVPAELEKMTYAQLDDAIAKKKRTRQAQAESIEQRRFYLEARGWCEMLGKKDGFAYHAFKDKFKADPRPEWRDLEVMVPSGGTESYMRSRLIKAAKGFAKRQVASHG